MGQNLWHSTCRFAVNAADMAMLRYAKRIGKRECTYFHDYLGGGFKHFLFSPLLAEDSHFDVHIFQMGWFNHQLVFIHPKGTLDSDVRNPLTS